MSKTTEKFTPIYEDGDVPYLPQFLTYTPIYRRCFFGLIKVLERIDVKRDVLATIQYEIEHGLKTMEYYTGELEDA